LLPQRFQAMLGSALVLVLGLSKEMEEVLGHPVAQVIASTISAIKIIGGTTTNNQPWCFNMFFSIRG